MSHWSLDMKDKQPPSEPYQDCVYMNGSVDWQAVILRCKEYREYHYGSERIRRGDRLLRE